jgi:hypothetical protein
VAELAEGFAAALTAELDFRIEAENMAAVAAATASHEDTQVRIPARFPELCTERVLVMEFLPGTTLSDPQAVAALPTERRETDAAALLESLLRQVMLDGADGGPAAGHHRGPGGLPNDPTGSDSWWAKKSSGRSGRHQCRPAPESRWPRKSSAV